MRAVVGCRRAADVSVASTVSRSCHGPRAKLRLTVWQICRSREAQDRSSMSLEPSTTEMLSISRTRKCIKMRTNDLGVGSCEVQNDGEEEAVDETTVISKFLRLPRDGKKIWIAPWGVTVMVQVMVLWFVGFCTVGNAVFPYFAGVLGFDTSRFTQRGLATYSLCLDFTQMLLTVFVLRQSLRQYQPLPVNWFPVKWFDDKKWLRDVAVACLAFPFVVWLHGFSTNLLEHLDLVVFDDAVSSAWEQSMRSNDLISKGFYLLLASFAAPVWEELIFRGFFFPSLTTFTGLKRSMLISSTMFAMAHFSLEQFLPLTFLGVLMCIVYVRTRNLLAPILLHSCWNAFVLIGELLPNSQSFNVFVSNAFYEIIQRLFVSV